MVLKKDEGTMKKTALIFLVLFLFYCGKDDSSTPEPGFVITGTVYLDDLPTSGVDVECGYSEETGVGHDWKNSVKKTDSEGKYRYEMQRMDGIYRYHVRAQDPMTSAWGDYIQSTVTWNKNNIHDFHFTSGE